MFSASKTAGPSGYNINNSLRFRRSATAYLNRTPASAGNRKTFTYSAWIKRGLSGNNNFFNVNPNTGYSGFSLNFDLNVSGDIGVYQNTSGTNTLVVSTNALFRDFSAWYHVVVAIDTTQATAANRVLIYVNGVSQALTISTQVALNTDLYVNSTIPHFIGREQTASGGAVNYFDGYMAEINFIDGQALTPSSFGSTNATTGVWQPAKYTGTYGTNGFYLPFSDIATTSGSNAGLGKDFSGNSNYWTTNNISVTAGTTYDAMTDSPTLTSATVANYCTLNPLANSSTNATTAANLDIVISAYTTGNNKNISGTMSVSSGKYYWEVNTTTIVASGLAIGVCTADEYLTQLLSSGIAYLASGSKSINGTITAYGASYTSGDIIGVALDVDGGTITFYKNNASQGAISLAGATVWKPKLENSTGSGAQTVSVNFGQRPFSYTPPTGFNRLNTYNLPDSTIKKGNSYMDATTYTGTGANGRQVTNQGGFEPGMIWIKNRSSAVSHIWQDTTRGVGASNALRSDTTGAESGQFVDAVNSTGYVVNGDTAVNGSGSSYVGWQWRTSSSTVTNTNGTISSQVRANPTSGVSVVTYTGTGANATVGHGLGVAPRMIIFKQRNAVRGWIVYHASLANASTVIYLNVTNAASTDTTAFNATAPTSSVFSVGTSADTNQSTGTYVAYCWAEIAGFSRFGSYTGNGSTDGPFVYTGFRPKYILVKITSTTDSWAIHDTSRSPYNTSLEELYPNLANAESTGASNAMDILSNGFKLRGTSNNTNGATFIYAAFAENPFKNALAR